MRGKRLGIGLAGLAALATAGVGLTAAGAAPVAEKSAYPLAKQNGRIVFQSLRDASNFDVWIMGGDGSNPVNLTKDAPADANPSFSPDGKKILFSAPDPGPGGDVDIFTMNPDGSNRVNLTSSSTDNDAGAFYFPDGKRIAFTRDVDPTAGTNFDVFVANADGTGAVNVTSARTTVNDFPTDISPDGTRLLMFTTDGGDPDVFAIGPDGSNPVNLTASRPGGEFDAEFTPDGTRVAMASDVDPAPATSDLDILLINSADGANPVNITSAPGDQRSPSPSPDGKRIAYEGPPGNIFLAGIDGSNPVNITPGADAHTPRWESLYTCGKRTATLIGSDGPDVIKGTKGPDVIVGNGANDKLVGRGGRDRICGGRGKDKLKGGPANDQLFGEAGKDQVVGGAGRDLVRGGKGRDVEKQ